MNLTNEQRLAIERGEAVAVTVDGTDAIVLRKDVYERVVGQVLGDSGWTDEESVRLGWEAGASIGWDTPEMAQYDDYDAHRKQS